MPHVILSGPSDFPGLFENFQPFRADANGWIIKVKNCLKSTDSRLLVFDCTAVRSGFSQDYYIRAEDKAGSITVRVDPYMRIERNEGVQRTIAALAHWIMQGSPAASMMKSNLTPEILSPGAVQ